MQMMFNCVQEEVFAARMRRVQTMLNELVASLEERSLTRDELTIKVKDVEKNLRKTREEL